MRIQIEYPFTTKWKVAYERLSKDGRRRIDFIDFNGNRSTISKARYVLSIKLGRELTSTEEADHINEIPSVDTVENLQVLSKANNIRKSHKGKTVVEHGTLSMYRYCKCLLCKAANTEYRRNWKKPNL